MNWDWAHAVTATIGAAVGAATSIFTAGLRKGRSEGRSEEQVKSHVEQSISAAEKRLEMKVDEARRAFDETLRGLREQINKVDKRMSDSELDAERRFLPREDFTDFVKEYREDRKEQRDDMKRLLDKLDHPSARRQ